MRILPQSILPLENSQPQAPVSLIPQDLILEIFMNLKLNQWCLMGSACKSLYAISQDTDLWYRKLTPVFPNRSLRHLGTEDLKELVQLHALASLEPCLSGAEKSNRWHIFVVVSWKFI